MSDPKSPPPPVKPRKPKTPSRHRRRHSSPFIPNFENPNKKTIPSIPKESLPPKPNLPKPNVPKPNVPKPNVPKPEGNLEIPDFKGERKNEEKEFTFVIKNGKMPPNIPSVMKRTPSKEVLVNLFIRTPAKDLAIDFANEVEEYEKNEKKQPPLPSARTPSKDTINNMADEENKEKKQPPLPSALARTPSKEVIINMLDEAKKLDEENKEKKQPPLPSALARTPSKEVIINMLDEAKKLDEENKEKKQPPVPSKLVRTPSKDMIVNILEESNKKFDEERKKNEENVDVIKDEDTEAIEEDKKDDEIINEEKKDVVEDQVVKEEVKEVEVKEVEAKEEAKEVVVKEDVKEIVVDEEVKEITKEPDLAEETIEEAVKPQVDQLPLDIQIEAETKETKQVKNVPNSMPSLTKSQKVVDEKPIEEPASIGRYVSLRDYKRLKKERAQKEKEETELRLKREAELARMPSLPSRVRRAPKEVLIEGGEKLEKYYKVEKFIKNVIKEFYSTEKMYVDNLILVKDEYILEMKKLKILPQKLHQMFFGSLISLIPINSMFLKKLEQLDPNSKDFSRIEFFQMILSFSNCFKLYSEYIKNFDEITERRMKEEKDNKKFKKFLVKKNDELKERKCRMTSLRSFLILPIQRIPRYKMLIENMIKEIKKTVTSEHQKEELECLTDSYQSISKVALYINKRKGEVDINNYLEELEKFCSLEDKDFIQPYRKILRMGKNLKCRVVTDEKKKRPRSCVVFLLVDLFIIMVGAKLSPKSKKKNGLKIKHHTVPLKACNITKTKSSDGVSITITFGSRGNSRSVELLFSNDVNLRNNWLNSLFAQMMEVRSIPNLRIFRNQLDGRWKVFDDTPSFFLSKKPDVSKMGSLKRSKNKKKKAFLFWEI